MAAKQNASARRRFALLLLGLSALNESNLADVSFEK
jgi:hypothetical protein